MRLVCKTCFVASLVAYALFLVSCGNKEVESHEKMKSILLETAKKFQNDKNLFANESRINYYDSLITVGDRFSTYRQYQKAVDLLRRADYQGAIALFTALEVMPVKELMASGFKETEIAGLSQNIALCYLRLGELENCIQNHTATSCIIPIRDGGYHSLPYGSEMAITRYKELLAQDSTDLSSQWLLNLAFMTLDQFPEKVPSQYLVPPESFSSEYPLKQFTDRAADIGFDLRGLSGGLIIDDFTRDGLLDIFVSEWGPTDPIRFFENQADGTFKEKDVGLEGITGGLNLIQADYNNDGWLDVLVLRGGWLREFGDQPNSLLKNNGDGTFTDVTIKAGLLSFHPTQVATWADFNNDGWLDLFIGNESSGRTSFHFSELFLNQKDGTFREVAKAAKVQVNKVGFRPSQHYIKGVTSGDYDNDGNVDLYISTGGLAQSSNFLFRNTGNDQNGTPIFEDVTDKAGLGGKISTFTTWFWDYNNDGWEDIFASSYRRSNGRGSITEDICAEYLGMPHDAEVGYLYHNNGDGTFTNISKEVKLDRIMYSMGANFGDFDNDGWLDFYLGTGNIGMGSLIPNRAFRNAGGRFFQDVTTAGGFGHLQKGHGVSFADIDNDGDQDLLMSMGGAFQGDVFQNAFFENPYAGTEGANHWIVLQLIGDQANRSAIGSKIIVEVSENGQKRLIHRKVSWGGSFGSSPLRQQIGLGKADKLHKITVQWAGVGLVESWQGLEMNQFWQLREGGVPKKMELDKLIFLKNTGQTHHHHLP